MIIFSQPFTSPDYNGHTCTSVCHEQPHFVPGQPMSSTHSTALVLLDYQHNVYTEHFQHITSLLKCIARPISQTCLIMLIIPILFHDDLLMKRDILISLHKSNHSNRVANLLLDASISCSNATTSSFLMISAFLCDACRCFCFLWNWEHGVNVTIFACPSTTYPSQPLYAPPVHTIRTPSFSSFTSNHNCLCSLPSLCWFLFSLFLTYAVFSFSLANSQALLAILAILLNGHTALPQSSPLLTSFINYDMAGFNRKTLS